MDLNSIVEQASRLAGDNMEVIVGAIAVVAILTLLRYFIKKPKVFFGLALLILFIAGVFYLIASVAMTGGKKKQGMISTEKKLLRDHTHIIRPLLFK